MSQNPYAGGREVAEPQEAIYGEPLGSARVSVMAVLSILCSLPCCVLPGMGIIGMTLGAVSLARIGSARGRLYGRGAAITGILLGVVTTAIWAYIAFGIAQGWTFYAKRVVPTSEQFLVALSKDDLTTARSLLTPDAAADLSDEELRRFIRLVEANHGAVSGSTASVEALFKSFERLYSGMQQPGPTGGQPGPKLQNLMPLPVAVKCAKGPTISWIVCDSATLNQQQVLIADMLIGLSKGQATPLRDDGPAVELGPMVGQKVVPYDQALPKEAAPEEKPSDGAGKPPG